MYMCCCVVVYNITITSVQGVYTSFYLHGGNTCDKRVYIIAQQSYESVAVCQIIFDNTHSIMKT